MLPPLQPHQSAEKPRSQDRPRKKAQVKAKPDRIISVKKQERIRVKILQRLLVQLKPRIDQGGIIGKSLVRLVRPMHKFAKLVTKTSSKVCEPKTYNEAVNDPILGNR